MSAAPKPTKRMLEFLGWAERAGRFSFWPIEFSAIQHRARKSGFIAFSFQPESRGFGLTEQGKRALAEARAA